jgi:hypothetical protein
VKEEEEKIQRIKNRWNMKARNARTDRTKAGVEQGNEQEIEMYIC